MNQVAFHANRPFLRIRHHNSIKHFRAGLIVGSILFVHPMNYSDILFLSPSTVWKLYLSESVCCSFLIIAVIALHRELHENASFLFALIVPLEIYNYLNPLFTLDFTLCECRIRKERGKVKLQKVWQWLQ